MDPEQTAEKIIAAIVKQLLVPLSVPERILAMYRRLRRAGEEISLDNATEMLRLACAAYDRVNICVDAFDELEERERKRVLQSLQAKEIPSLVYLFATGRDHVKSIFEDFFKPDEMSQIQIKADERDVRSFIN